MLPTPAPDDIAPRGRGSLSGKWVGLLPRIMGMVRCDRWEGQVVVHSRISSLPFTGVERVKLSYGAFYPRTPSWIR